MHELALLPLVKATWETIYMVFISSFLSIVGGLFVGLCLFLTDEQQALHNKTVNRSLGFVVNVTRSVPYIILMISILPLTRLLVGTTIGTNAAIVPLTLAAIPFFARVSESAFKEVPGGLIEALHAMGATTWQTVRKVIVPESLPNLVRGATLTIIALTGYSAMAGVVGGGGLGELAINYGYQRFNAWVMLETVIALVVLVQLIQLAGDWMAKTRRVKPVLYASVFLWAACIASQVWPVAATHQTILRVGIMSGWSEDIMNTAQQIAARDYDLKLVIVPFNDYVQPNTALNNGSIDANIFQHVPYLNAQIKAQGYQLTPIAKTFVFPIGFYSRKIKQLSQLKNDAIIAVPNDPSNEGRALLLLQKAKLIRLKKNIGTKATVEDITANPRHFKFKLLDSAQLPRVLKDATLVALTNDFIAPTGLTIQDALLKEGANSPYANVIVVRTRDRHRPAFKALVDVMHSKAVVDKTEKLFPKGAAIPAWKTNP
jgi:D-methionine transport system permease protein/D-methionine transport system substrate-binding protein